MLKGRRGVSEVLGAILIAIIVISMSVTYVMFGLERSSRETTSIIELIRAAEKRQRQLLSLIYYHEQGNKLILYIYNYGEETSNITRILTNQDVPLDKIEMKDLSSDTPINDQTINPKTLVELTILEAEKYVPDNDFNLVLFTEEGGIYSWRIVK